MKYHKISSTDAFISFDLGDAPAAGITRLARKVLVDGATLLARSTTYSFASFGIQMGGGSAGINAEGDGRDAAVAAFVEEAATLVSAGRWATDPGLGLTEADFAPLRTGDPRPAALWTDGLAESLTAQGAVAAAGAVRSATSEHDGLTGATVVVIGSGPVVDAAHTAISAAGATLGDGGVDAPADVVFLAGKTGMYDHDMVPTTAAGIVVPLTPLPVTARAHAELTKAGTVHVPDFVAIAAPLLAAHDPDGGDPVERVAGLVAELAGEGTGLWRAAIDRAETFLATWQDELPFGRPLA